MKKFEVKNLQDLNDFFMSNEKLKFNYKCHRNDDDYSLQIEAYSVKSDKDSWGYNSSESFTIIKIHIDSQKFMEAYYSLPESEQIPPKFEIYNPCLHGYYMLFLLRLQVRKYFHYWKILME